MAKVPFRSLAVLSVCAKAARVIYFLVAKKMYVVYSPRVYSYAIHNT